ncbi:MAG: PTS transporter subunit EIIB [Acutalibacteraceae bacterium]
MHARKRAMPLLRLMRFSAMITKGLGGANNISDVDCCATRLRVTVNDATRWKKVS